MYLLLSYILLRFLLPGGSLGCEYGDGGVWRNFSKNLFVYGSVLREYLELLLNDRQLPKKFVKEESLDGAQFIFAAFPHGCGSEFRVLMDGVIQQVMPNIIAKNNLRVLAASVLFYIPIVREVALWTGCIDASKKTAEKALDRKRSLLILPGGEAEQLLTTYGEEKVYLSRRKGFLKLAMRKRIAVVPIYVFGSSDYYYTSRLR
jgi:2-acylglycerol O-acyltransferase 2